MEYTWGSNFTSAHLGTSIILSSVLSGLAESIIVLRLDSRDIQPVAEFNTLCLNFRVQVIPNYLILPQSMKHIIRCKKK